MTISFLLNSPLFIFEESSSFCPLFKEGWEQQKISSAGGQDVVVVVVQQPWVVKRCAVFRFEGKESQLVE